jgi:hypothetical protein
VWDGVVTGATALDDNCSHQRVASPGACASVQHQCEVISL